MLPPEPLDLDRTDIECPFCSKVAHMLGRPDSDAVQGAGRAHMILDHPAIASTEAGVPADVLFQRWSIEVALYGDRWHERQR